MNRHTLLVGGPGREEVVERLAAFCRQYPRYYGIFFQAVRLWGSAPLQLRFFAGLAKRHAKALLRPSRLASPSSEILVDARHGGRQAALWLPVAREIAQKGFDVALTHMDGGLPDEVRGLLSTSEQEFRAFTMPYTLGRRFRNLVEQRRRLTLEFGGLFGFALRCLLGTIDQLIDAWSDLLEATCVRMVISAEIFSLWSSALFIASQDLRIPTVYLQQGLIMWPCPVCSLAIVWTAVGEKLIRLADWDGARVMLARNPSIPPPDAIERLRQIRRSELGLDRKAFCVLFLGQKSFDQSFNVAGYTDTVKLICDGLVLAGQRTSDLVALLRPHYNEEGHETERLMRRSDGLPLMVSSEKDLMADVAASDVVIGMDSAAMEEAYLAGRPIVQVIARGYRSDVDFAVLSAPRVDDAGTLAGLMCRRDWIDARPPLPVYPSVADVLIDFLGAEEQVAQGEQK